jgi:hypothetical protein
MQLQKHTGELWCCHCFVRALNASCQLTSDTLGGGTHSEVLPCDLQLLDGVVNFDGATTPRLCVRGPASCHNFLRNPWCSKICAQGGHNK